jgi:hypothetical protein
MKKTMSAAFLVAALALTSACGGGDDRPTKDEVKSAITSEDSVFGTAIPAKNADCVADVLVDSDVSDKTLKAIVDNDKDFKGTKDDEKALTAVQGDLAKCVTPATPDASETPAPAETTPAQ